ncbi:MAG: hypothetical protein QXD60_04255 [Nanopusillaceae archaeon]
MEMEIFLFILLIFLIVFIVLKIIKYIIKTVIFMIILILLVHFLWPNISIYLSLSEFYSKIIKYTINFGIIFLTIIRSIMIRKKLLIK